MRNQEVELAVGDVLQFGEHTVTVLDIDGDEVSFRIDDGTAHDPLSDRDGQTNLPR